MDCARLTTQIARDLSRGRLRRSKFREHNDLAGPLSLPPVETRLRVSLTERLRRDALRASGSLPAQTKLAARERSLG
jgi:hypothetical protein